MLVELQNFSRRLLRPVVNWDPKKHCFQIEHTGYNFLSVCNVPSWAAFNKLQPNLSVALATFF
jgi:hypothetical protein